MADIQFTETKGGWLARLDSFPRFMGAGDSQEAAERDLARVVAAFNRSLGNGDVIGWAFASRLKKFVKLDDSVGRLAAH